MKLDPQDYAKEVVASDDSHYDVKMETEATPNGDCIDTLTSTFLALTWRICNE